MGTANTKKTVEIIIQLKSVKMITAREKTVKEDIQENVDTNKTAIMDPVVAIYTKPANQMLKKMCLRKNLMI